MAALVTVDDLQTYLQRDIDAEVGELAATGATGIIRDYCGWHIAPTEPATFTVDGNGTAMLSLPTLKLTEVTAVRIDGDEVTDYQWSERGQLYRSQGWPARMRCVQVDCSHGWDVTPPAVRAVGLAIATRIIVNPDGLRSKTVGGVTSSFSPDGMTELQLAQIGRYRL